MSKSYLVDSKSSDYFGRANQRILQVSFFKGMPEAYQARVCRYFTLPALLDGEKLVKFFETLAERKNLFMLKLLFNNLSDELKQKIVNSKRFIMLVYPFGLEFIKTFLGSETAKENFYKLTMALKYDPEQGIKLGLTPEYWQSIEDYLKTQLSDYFVWQSSMEARTSSSPSYKPVRFSSTEYREVGAFDRNAEVYYHNFRVALLVKKDISTAGSYLLEMINCKEGTEYYLYSEPLATKKDTLIKLAFNFLIARQNIEELKILDRTEVAIAYASYLFNASWNFTQLLKPDNAEFANQFIAKLMAVDAISMRQKARLISNFIAFAIDNGASFTLAKFVDANISSILELSADADSEHNFILLAGQLQASQHNLIKVLEVIAYGGQLETFKQYFAKLPDAAKTSDKLNLDKVLQMLMLLQPYSATVLQISDFYAGDLDSLRVSQRQQILNTSNMQALTLLNNLENYHTEVQSDPSTMDFIKDEIAAEFISCKYKFLFLNKLLNGDPVIAGFFVQALFGGLDNFIDYLRNLTAAEFDLNTEFGKQILVISHSETESEEILIAKAKEVLSIETVAAMIRPVSGASVLRVAMSPSSDTRVVHEPTERVRLT